MNTFSHFVSESVTVVREVARVAHAPAKQAVKTAGTVINFGARKALQSKYAEELLGAEQQKSLQLNLDVARRTAKELGYGWSTISTSKATHEFVSGVNEVLKTIDAPVKCIQKGDDEWTRVKIIEDVKQLSEYEQEITPRDFIKFMRNSNKSTAQNARLNEFIGDMFHSKLLHSHPLIPQQFEKKLYIDVAKVMNYTIITTLMKISGTNLWGHEIIVTEKIPTKAVSHRFEEEGSQLDLRVLDQVVEELLDATKPILPRPLARVLYYNVGMVFLNLMEQQLSSDKIEATMLGHRITWRLEPLRVDEAKKNSRVSLTKIKKLVINEKVIRALVDELLEDAEINLLMVPDVIESAAYRHVFTLVVRICEEILCGLKFNIFGVDVNFSIVNAASQREIEAETNRIGQLDEGQKEQEYGFGPDHIRLSLSQMQNRLKENAEERRVLEQLIYKGHPLSSKEGKSHEGSLAEPVHEDDLLDHEFHRIAQVDRLARSLRLRETVKVDINIPYIMIGDFEKYVNWMPYATHGKFTSAPDIENFGENGQQVRKRINAEVGFGIDTKSFLGVFGDDVQYDAQMEPPVTKDDGYTYARVIADATRFRFGESLIYDWRFKMNPAVEGEEPSTDVRLDVFFKTHNVLYLPIWDAMQNALMSNLFHSFRAHAKILKDKQESGRLQFAESEIIYAASTSTSNMVKNGKAHVTENTMAAPSKSSVDGTLLYEATTVSSSTTTTTTSKQHIKTLGSNVSPSSTSTDSSNTRVKDEGSPSKNRDEMDEDDGTTRGRAEREKRTAGRNG